MTAPVPQVRRWRGYRHGNRVVPWKSLPSLPPAPPPDDSQASIEREPARSKRTTPVPSAAIEIRYRSGEPACAVSRVRYIAAGFPGSVFQSRQISPAVASLQQSRPSPLEPLRQCNPSASSGSVDILPAEPPAKENDLSWH